MERENPRENFSALVSFRSLVASFRFFPLFPQNEQDCEFVSVRSFTTLVSIILRINEEYTVIVRPSWRISVGLRFFIWSRTFSTSFRVSWADSFKKISLIGLHNETEEGRSFFQKISRSCSEILPINWRGTRAIENMCESLYSRNSPSSSVSTKFCL